MENDNMIVGKLGEEIASRYLAKNGYIIIQRNYSTKIGEIDIIAIKDNLLIIIEVKTRKDFSISLASCSVNNKKQSTIKNVCNQYIIENRLFDMNIRFDIIECYWKIKKINHIKNAF